MKIDNTFLASLGLTNIPEAEKQRMIADIYENLAARLGYRAEKSLDPAKLDELDKIAQSGTPESTQQWLEQHLPNYAQIVDEETAKIKDEIRPQVPGILQQFVGAN